MSHIIIFVCHNNESISQVIHYNKQIILVGNTEINDEYKNNPNITIARNLEHNIEYEPKLLTFTAWYAISKNKLFRIRIHKATAEINYFQAFLKNNCNTIFQVGR